MLEVFVRDVEPVVGLLQFEPREVQLAVLPQDEDHAPEGQQHEAADRHDEDVVHGVHPLPPDPVGLFDDVQRQCVLPRAEPRIEEPCVVHHDPHVTHGALDVVVVEQRVGEAFQCGVVADRQLDVGHRRACEPHLRRGRVVHQVRHEGAHVRRLGIFARKGLQGAAQPFGNLHGLRVVAGADRLAEPEVEVRDRLRFGVLHDQLGVDHRKPPRFVSLRRVVGVELEFVVEFVAGDVVVDQLPAVQRRGVDQFQHVRRFEVDTRRTVQVGQLDTALVEVPRVVHACRQGDVAVEVVDGRIGLVGGVFVDQLLVEDVALGVREIRFPEDVFQRFDPLFASGDVGVPVRKGGVEL